MIQSHRRNSVVLDNGMGGGYDEHAVINPEDNGKTEASVAPHLPFTLLSDGSLPGVTFSRDAVEICIQMDPCRKSGLSGSSTASRVSELNVTKSSGSVNVSQPHDSTEQPRRSFIKQRDAPWWLVAVQLNPPLC